MSTGRKLHCKVMAKDIIVSHYASVKLGRTVRSKIGSLMLVTFTFESVPRANVARISRSVPSQWSVIKR